MLPFFDFELASSNSEWTPSLSSELDLDTSDFSDCSPASESDRHDVIYHIVRSSGESSPIVNEVTRPSSPVLVKNKSNEESETVPAKFYADLLAYCEVLEAQGDDLRDQVATATFESRAAFQLLRENKQLRHTSQLILPQLVGTRLELKDTLEVVTQRGWRIGVLEERNRELVELNADLAGRHAEMKGFVEMVHRRGSSHSPIPPPSPAIVTARTRTPKSPMTWTKATSEGPRLLKVLSSKSPRETSSASWRRPSQVTLEPRFAMSISQQYADHPNLPSPSAIFKDDPFPSPPSTASFTIRRKQHQVSASIYTCATPSSCSLWTPTTSEAKILHTPTHTPTTLTHMTLHAGKTPILPSFGLVVSKGTLAGENQNCV